jgi:glycosyltransferase involved in cell wall biosynthesis
MLVTDYPKDKIEWIVVDDSDDPMEQNSDRIVAVGNAADPVKFVYVPLRKKTPVSEKRNQGVAKASNKIVLFMDDDDHYPETSFRRRVAWLTLHPWNPRAVAATTIACYDLVKGISAVNVPPLDLPVSQRISEATLTFYRDFWEAKKFPQGVVVGEGAEFIEGRESEFLEIPPQQIIVAFSHGKNVSSRRVPSDPDTPPSCFWGFPKEFLQFIHGLAGITVSTATE